ncbi:hypothetical protein BDQ12DRAFT_677670 [Crucibulum laeve]|uniref:Uncharacterized protein n=1 Tax=Crucibulum laeve TaxID=68775 RepID=A0A5C3MCI1_9AGAR|nr:hypothetical protein BDQ12DRAFT_677670 [Crucibulum laeve]
MKYLCLQAACVGLLWADALATAVVSSGAAEAPSRPLRSQDDLCSDAEHSAQHFLSHSNANLPEGTYIITGVNSTFAFRDYLLRCTETVVKRLLLSDASEHDLENHFGGYQSLLVDMNEKEREEIRHHNTKLDIQWREQSNGRTEAVATILDTVAPNLEALSYLAYHGDLWFSDPCYECIGERPEGIRNILFGRTFPLLKELTVRDTPESLFLAVCHGAFGSEFPTLTHLHLAGQIYCPVIGSAYLANMKYLRVSGEGGLEEVIGGREERRADPFPGLLGVMQDYLFPLEQRLAFVPPNTTLIVQPAYMPSGGDANMWDPKSCYYSPCYTDAISYHRYVLWLLARHDLHVHLPYEEDFEKHSLETSLFPMSRAISEFSDRSRGGEGEWAIPERPSKEDFWWLRNVTEVPGNCEEYQDSRISYH